MPDLTDTLTDEQIYSWMDSSGGGGGSRAINSQVAGRVGICSA